MPSLVHHAGNATLMNPCFVAVLACSFGLPRRLPGTGAGNGAPERNDGGDTGEGDSAGRGARQGSASVRDN
jgi:hypothetical protein